MYIIVVGAGRTGSSVIELATRDDHDVVVVERDEALAAETSTAYDCLVINADAASRETLLEAGIDEADALISTTDDDSVNLMLSMLGKQFGVETLVSSINDPEHMDLFRELGVNIVESPHRLNGQYLYRAVQRPAVQDFMTVPGGAEIFEVAVEDGAPLDGVSLLQAGEDGLLAEDTVLVAIARDDEIHIPGGDTTLEAGDLVTIFALDGATDAVTAPFTSD